MIYLSKYFLTWFWADYILIQAFLLINGFAAYKTCKYLSWESWYYSHLIIVIKSKKNKNLNDNWTAFLFMTRIHTLQTFGITKNTRFSTKLYFKVLWFMRFLVTCFSVIVLNDIIFRKEMAFLITLMAKILGL